MRAIQGVEVGDAFERQFKEYMDKFPDLPKPRDRFEEIIEELRDLHGRKRNDYTMGEHPLENYRNAAKFAGNPTSLQIGARLAEKLYRLGVVLKKGAWQVKDESPVDTLNDIAICAVLCRMAWEEEKAERGSQPDTA